MVDTRDLQKYPPPTRTRAGSTPTSCANDDSSFYGALKVKPLVICFPYVSYLL